MVSRHCQFSKELQTGLAQLERGGPPRRLGDVLPDVLTQWDVVLHGPGSAAIDTLSADWPWSESLLPEELDIAGERDSCAERVWAVA